MVTPPKPMTEEDAKRHASTVHARSQFLNDAAMNRYGSLEITKVACLMADRITELEDQLSWARMLALTLHHNAEKLTTYLR